MIRRHAALTAAGVVTLMLVAAAAWGHAKLLRAVPAPGSTIARTPTIVRLWFNEELDTKRSGLSVWNARGQRVDDGHGGVDLNDLDRKAMKVVLKPILPGRYTVRWRAVSADDLFVSTGSFTFTVRHP
ncbi:MAG TPA: copper resistance protein CopC [bacterium]|jgi:methionine-rich copper-binding protein CopC|nr:copper resistance protein CopC [bacterium]